MSEDQLFFVGQKAFVEKDGKVLILFNPRNQLDFPGGKIKEGEEDYVESLLREVREETGLEIKIEDPFTIWSFSLPPQHLHAGKKVFLVGFKAKYLSGEVSLSDEHGSFRWVNEADLAGLENSSGHLAALKKYFGR